MILNLNEKFLTGFVSANEIENIKPGVKVAQQLLVNGEGAGNDFHGWVKLPSDYDKEEFARIKLAAEKIKKNSDILVVIGIGGSYLGHSSEHGNSSPSSLLSCQKHLGTSRSLRIRQDSVLLDDKRISQGYHKEHA